VTADEYAQKIEAVENWARDEIAAIIAAGPRPSSCCPKSEDLIYAQLPMLAEIAQVEALLHFVSENLTGRLFHEPTRAPATNAEAAALARFA
jgi:hypothetical protein